MTTKTTGTIQANTEATKKLAIELSDDNRVESIVHIGPHCLATANCWSIDPDEYWQTLELIIDGVAVGMTYMCDNEWYSYGAQYTVIARLYTYMVDNGMIDPDEYEDLKSYIIDGQIEDLYYHCNDTDIADHYARLAKIEQIRWDYAGDWVCVGNNYESNTDRGFTNTYYLRAASEGDTSSFGWHNACNIADLDSMYDDELLSLYTDDFGDISQPQ